MMQQKIIIGLVLTLSILIFIPLYWATESGRQEEAQERLVAESAERGTELYASHCATCHGPTGEGKIGPALKGSLLTESALEKRIIRGIAGTAMPALGEEDGGPLKKHQIKDLVTFIKNWEKGQTEAAAASEAGGVAIVAPTPASQPSTPVAVAPAGAGETIFENKCSACHTIGGGRTIGPDLKDVTDQRDRDWLIQFVTSPEQLIERGDPIAKQLVEEYGMEMPNLGLSDDDVEEVLAYIEAQSEGEPSSPPPKQNIGGVTPVPDTEVTTPAPPERETDESSALLKGNANMGKDIFTGNIPLKNGGAACFSCHNVDGIAALGGGTVAKDLTEAYSNLGEAGLTSVLEAMPFPLMKTIYDARPLEDDEVANLVAFLGETGGTEQLTSGRSQLIFIAIGIAGLLLIVIILQIIWRGRLSGVRQSLVRGGSK